MKLLALLSALPTSTHIIQKDYKAPSAECRLFIFLSWLPQKLVFPFLLNINIWPPVLDFE